MFLSGFFSSFDRSVISFPPSFFIGGSARRG